MQFPFARPKSILGLDIGSSSVKVVECTTRKGGITGNLNSATSNMVSILRSRGDGTFAELGIVAARGANLDFRNALGDLDRRRADVFTNLLEEILERHRRGERDRHDAIVPPGSHLRPPPATGRKTWKRDHIRRVQPLLVVFAAVMIWAWLISTSIPVVVSRKMSPSRTLAPR